MDQHFPRKERDFARAQLAADRIRAAGGNATMEVLEGVAEMQCPQFIHNSIKLAADLTISRGITHETNRMRFGLLADLVRRGGVETSIRQVTDLWKDASADLHPWHMRRDRHTADRLRHDLIVLRWLRRYHSADIPGIVEALTR